MKYFEPELCPASVFFDTLLGKDKFGGLPWGFPREKWPSCAICGQPMNHICQLNHHKDRLDLGKEGRVLFSFQCDNSASNCQSWRKDSGANYVCILEKSELAPGPRFTKDNPYALYFESVVVSWHEEHDAVPSELERNFFDDTLLMELPDEIYEAPKQITRLGSVPSFIQNADEAPKFPWRFILQMTDYFAFDMPISDDLLSGANVSYRDGRCYVDGPNFGTGIAYVFINTAEDTAKGLMFSQS